MTRQAGTLMLLCRRPDDDYGNARSSITGPAASVVLSSVARQQAAMMITTNTLPPKEHTKLAVDVSALLPTAVGLVSMRKHRHGPRPSLHMEARVNQRGAARPASL
ncbi:hypothetical protein HPB50_024115 [Hyalomma asiaticum]|uniref:Uncharacterized protein n=1 Tax=Hyalomma asiaticum TaxID=266040 RepID=A0ACB7RKZ3_HYAAI|nr:hypothetical protein HPB50_024115 [Hyalomma asiaticum]